MKESLNLSMSDVAGNTPRTIVAASSDWLAPLASSSIKSLAQLQFIAMGPQEALRREQLRNCELLVLEVDAASLDRLENVKRMFPDLPIIAAVQSTDLTVMRTLLQHGVSNAVGLPFEQSQLEAEIYNLGARLAENMKVPMAPSISVIGSLGRSGASSVLLHLASALVAESSHPVRCCLIDLDLQRGHLAAGVGLETSRTILSLLEADDRLDRDMIRNVATKAREGLYIIAAPSAILPIDQVDIDQLLRIVALAQAEFDYVFVDLPALWTNWSLSIASESDNIVVVTQQTLPHLRQARRFLELFREVGIARDKVDVIVNRAVKGRFQSISIGDVADILDCNVFGTLREDRGELSEAIDQGKLVTELSRKNVFAIDIANLTRDLRDQIDKVNS